MSNPWANLAAGASNIVREYEETIAPNLFEPVCDSPIEVLFGSAFYLACALHGTPLSVLKGLAEVGANPFIIPQFSMGRFRADFLIGVGSDGGALRKCIVVECDGHDFHEKTKEQAARDKSRDRELNATVAKVLRFTGSELHARPYECANETWEIMAQVHTGWPS